LYSPNIRAIRAKRMKWAKHVPLMGGKCKVMVHKSDKIHHWEELVIDKGIIFKWLLNEVLTGLIWLRMGASGRLS
jgi:hypothetical protein